ncbi:unnamed protein product, partial [Ectocarpus sp. 12 AP-2014]
GPRVYASCIFVRNRTHAGGSQTAVGACALEAAAMTEAAAMELAVSSGLVGGVSQLAKSGVRKITRWVDRAKGLKLLKNLPKGPLEAFVFGEDEVTPELLAALSLGGTPGTQLSMIALLKARHELFTGEFFLCQNLMDIPNEMTTWDEVSDVRSAPKEARRTRMDGETHYFTVLDIRSLGVEMR